MIKTIVTDIEGTTSSLSFVKDVLFPYARERMAAFIREHAADAEVSPLLRDVATQARRALTVDESISELRRWIDEDRKYTSLKAIQGLIWQNGYRQGDFHGHIYADAYEQLKAWREAGLHLYVFSSGSVYAQKLLFGHTEYGDLTPLFNGYFDTRVGAKIERTAYEAIVAEIGRPTSEIIFLSDIVAELDAAKQAGLHTIWFVRDGGLQTDPPHPQVRSFSEIDLGRFS